jgi:transcriptional regulator with XRE-family HTH domain
MSVYSGIFSRHFGRNRGMQMAKIVPFVLKTLRKRKGLSQERLAELAKLNKQTIHRLENDDAGQEATRGSTVAELAKVLRTEEGVLTGERPLPDPQDVDGLYPDMTKLNFEISTGARNALYLMAERYSIPQAFIVEVAPYLFAWAAEASLRQRRERLDRMEAALIVLKDADEALDHLQRTGFETLKDKIEQEKTAIGRHDIWGMGTEYHQYSDDKLFDNPFGVFVDGLAEEIGDGTVMEQFPWDDWPIYRLCPKQVERFIGESELADAILRGEIALHQMPKELREGGAETKNKRREWARSKLEGYRTNLRRQMDKSLSEEPSK